MTQVIEFCDLQKVPRELLLAQMNDARVAEHLPLLEGAFDDTALDGFLSAKAQRWINDGLGHWAIWQGEVFLGWGGFEKEDDVWDFGLVLVPAAFGQGLAITRQALVYAQQDARIETVQFLLAPTRRSVKALARMGAKETGEVHYGGQTFRRFLLDVSA
ncbi:GNAT family protein [uncultured Shimia sp.]|uniref:GNAT family N-acetyltransferase n=1 Tax=uncultured Shimia sp. TaxID=573152 RepID=UPI0025F1639C|nr:GNAT family protein [uncultured Shimia sp.]